MEGLGFMEELDKWTVTEFRRVENELLKKKDRRTEIPQKISEKEQNIRSWKRQNNDLKEKIQRLEEEKKQKEYELRQLRINLSKTYAAGPMDDEMARRLEQDRIRMESAIANTEARLEQIINNINNCSGEIRKNDENIRVEELTIKELEEEDKKIIKECEEYAKTFQNVSTEAEKAAQMHNSAADKFLQAGTSRFGKSTIQSGQNMAKENSKNFRNKGILALNLCKLALAIIQGGNNNISSVSTGGGAGVSSGGIYNQNQNVMDMGYGSILTSSQKLGHSNEGMPANPDGTTDFSEKSLCGAINYDSATMESTDYLDKKFGERTGLSGYEVTRIRQDSGLVWRVEGNKVYMISQEYEAYGSSRGYTIPEDTHTIRSRKKG